MLKGLKRTHLETLLKAVKTRGAEPGSCIEIPAVARVPIGSGEKSCQIAAHIFLCQIFRWPDLQSDIDMKRLSYCRLSSDDICDNLQLAAEKQPAAEKQTNLGLDCRNFKHPGQLYECCNPYHWSRITKSSSSPSKSIKVTIVLGLSLIHIFHLD